VHAAGRGSGPGEVACDYCLDLVSANDDLRRSDFARMARDAEAGAFDTRTC
jgi:hypothetical protein